MSLHSLSDDKESFPSCLVCGSQQVECIYPCLGTEYSETGTTLTPSATLQLEVHMNGPENLGSDFCVMTRLPSLALKGWRQKVRMEPRLFPSR